MPHRTRQIKNIQKSPADVAVHIGCWWLARFAEMRCRCLLRRHMRATPETISHSEVLHVAGTTEGPGRINSVIPVWSSPGRSMRLNVKSSNATIVPPAQLLLVTAYEHPGQPYPPMQLFGDFEQFSRVAGFTADVWRPGKAGRSCTTAGRAEGRLRGFLSRPNPTSGRY